MSEASTQPFPFTTPVMFVNEGMGYVDAYSYEPEVMSHQSMMADFVKAVEPRAEVLEPWNGLKQARLKVTTYKKAIADGVIAPKRDAADPPYTGMPQIYRSSGYPERRIKNILSRLQDDMRAAGAL